MILEFGDDLDIFVCTEDNHELMFINHLFLLSCPRWSLAPDFSRVTRKHPVPVVRGDLTLKSDRHMEQEA